MRLSFAQSRRRGALVAALAAGALILGACGAADAATTPASSASNHHNVTVRDTANGKWIWVNPGDRVELILGSSYWHVQGSSAPRVLKQMGPTVVMPRPSSCPPIPGLGCAPVRTDFVALARGKAVIKASRTTCGEALACDAKDSHYTVTIAVR